MIYGAGLPAFVLQKVLSPIYFAREDTRTPFRFALVSMLVNALIAIGLAPVMGYLSAALATTTAGWVMFGLLYRGATRIDGGIEPDARLRRTVPRLLLSSLVMAGVLVAGAAILSQALGTHAIRYLALALLVLVGMAIYGLTCSVSGAFTLSDLKRTLRRR